MELDAVYASLARFVPELILTAGVLLVTVVEATGIASRALVGRVVTIAALVGALATTTRPEAPGALFAGMLADDALATFFKTLLIAASLLVVIVFTFRNSRELHGLGQGEFHILLLGVTLSNVLLSAANDLAMLYLSLEMVSITSYVMVAYVKGDRLSNEASLKYVLFGAVSTGAMLYGLSLLYGLAGTTSFPGIRDFLALGLDRASAQSLYIIVLLVFAGFGFKTAATPFHFWCPDVYQGAPTPVTAFLSVAPKAAGFAVMTRFFFSGLSFQVASEWDLEGAVQWAPLLMLASVVTMTLGNVAALTQTDLKRLFAYSSIAHAGYIMMGVVALSADGVRGMLVYLVAYLFMNLGAFLVVTLVHNAEDTFDLRDYPGLFTRAPVLAVAMAIFLLSLMGIPPFVGFMGKLYVFAAIIDKGPDYYWYALVGAVNAAIAAYYYFRILRTMIVDADEEAKPAITLPVSDRVAVIALAAANVVPILIWGYFDGWARGALSLYSGL